MVLRGIGPSTSERTLENAEMVNLVDVELFPSVPRTALTLAANLKPEQGFDAMSDPVVMRLNNSRASGFVGELDETLVDNRAHQFVIHDFTSSSRSSGRGRRAPRLASLNNLLSSGAAATDDGSSSRRDQSVRFSTRAGRRGSGGAQVQAHLGRARIHHAAAETARAHSPPLDIEACASGTD
jgi:hypothetical protein